MKGTVLIVLFVIVVTALSPVCVLTVPAASAEKPALCCLDVCRSSAPALSSNGSAPCLCSCFVTAIPVLETAVRPPQSPFFSELILSTGNDRPPQA
jgi:hypothetical protein